MDGQAQKISRRRFLVLGAQGAAALALARCAPQQGTPAVVSTQGGAPTSPPKAPVTIDFLAWGDPVDVPAWEQLTTLFMERNPNATVNLTTVADPNANFYPKLQTAIAGGTPPHVASFQPWEWQSYADRGLLAALDDYIAADSYFPTLFPAGVESIALSTQRSGKRYLLPTNIGTMLMFYAKKPFDEAGLPYPTDDWTFEEFLDIAQKLTDTSGEVKRFGIQANGNWFRDIHYLRSTGKQEFDSIENPKRSTFNQPELVEMTQTVVYDVYHTLKISPTAADQAGGANTIDTGNSAMKYEGPWYLTRLNNPDLRAQNKQIEFDVVMMPIGPDGTRGHRGWAEGIAVLQTDNVQAGWDLASFITSEEGSTVYSSVTGRMPNSFALMEQKWVPWIEETYEVKNGKAFVEAFRNGYLDVVGVPRSKIWSEVVKPVGWDPMIGGSATAAEVLPKVDEGVQKLLDEFWASS